MDGNRDIHASQSELRLRLERCDNARLAGIVGDMTDAITDIVNKHQISIEEFRAAVAFARDIGLATDDRRNEWVLLFDTMGISGAVEAANLIRPTGATPQTMLGPFHRSKAPAKANGDTISIDNVGTPLTFFTKVVDLEGQPIPDATVDVWQANSDGVYENQDPDSQPEFNLRGRFQTDARGQASFQTVRPAGYTLPEDGPVGHLMRLLGQSMTRPAHIHFRVEAKGFQTLVTQVLDRSDPHIETDPLFCASSELRADFGDRSSPDSHNIRFTFKLARSRPGASQN
jgi:protocatechuate 3,4-dioxygenase beta subunit